MFGGENVKCPSCGSENNDSAKFCKNCGENLQVSSSQDKSSQDTSTRNTSAQISPSSEPKSNKNLLIICATAVICVIIIAGAFLALNSSNSGISDNANSAMGLDDSGISSLDYYSYNFRGYPFNIPNAFYYYNYVDDHEFNTHSILFKEDEVRNIVIIVAEDSDSISDEDFKEMNEGLTPTTMGNIDGYLNKTTQGDAVAESFAFRTGNDIIWVMVSYIGDPVDIEPIISSIQQEDVPSSSSSSSSSNSVESMTYSDASSYLSGASSTVIENTFDEADANGDGVLTGSEISKFKKLADLTKRTADTSNTENVEAQDYAGTGDGTTKTRYCTTHGRVAVGDDNLCPYCLDEGLDARTVKDSTEYI